MKIALKAVNGQYVCAQNGGGQELIANRNVVDAWEQFDVTMHYTQPPLVSGNQISLKANNGQYVCALGGGGDLLQANRPWSSTWENFTITKDGGGSINNGDPIFLQASNGQYVCADNAGNGPLTANRNAAGAWEQFIAQIDGPPPADTEFLFSTNPFGLVLSLNNALTQRVVAFANDAGAIKRELTAAAQVTSLPPQVLAVIAVVAVYISVEVALVKLVNRGNGVHLTQPYLLPGLIVPTTR